MYKASDSGREDRVTLSSTKGKVICAIAFLLLTTTAFVTLPSTEDVDAGSTCGDLWWDLDGDTLVISGQGAMDDRTDGKYPWYFNHTPSYINHIKLNEGIVSLGTECFKNLNITGDIVIPKSMETIGKRAFQGTGITGLIFAEESNMESIGEEAFAGCSHLETFNLPEGLLSIGYHAFIDCTELTDSLRLPSTLKSIGIEAFKNCSKMTGSIEIPNGVSSLMGCFEGCSSLTGNIKLSSNLVLLGNATFKDCSGLTGTVKISHPYCFGVGEDAFKGCTSITGVEIQGNVICKVYNGAFEGCTGLTSFKLMQGSSIDDGAFTGCTNMTKMTFGSKIETINPTAFGDIEFYDEDGKKIELTTDSVKELKGYVFEGSDGKLTRVAQTDEDIPDKEDESSGNIDIWMIATPVAFIAGVLATILVFHIRKP